MVIQFIRRRDRGNDNQSCFICRRNPLHGVTAERFPKSVELPGFRIKPSESAASVMTQSEPAEINFAVSAKFRTVHQPDTSGSVKVAQVARIASGIGLVRRWIAGRSALAQRPGPRRIVHKKMTARIAAEVKFAFVNDSGVRRQADARAAINGLIGLWIKNECADVILARSIKPSVRQQ